MAKQNNNQPKSSAPKTAPKGRKPSAAGKNKATQKSKSQPKKKPESKELMQGISNSPAGQKQKRYYKNAAAAARKPAGKKRKKATPPLKIAFLGGLNEVALCVQRRHAAGRLRAFVPRPGNVRH